MLKSLPPPAAILALIGFLWSLPPAIAKPGEIWQPSPPGLLAQLPTPAQGELQDRKLIVSDTEVTVIEGEEGTSFTVHLIDTELKNGETIEVTARSSDAKVEIKPSFWEFTAEKKSETVKILLEDNEIEEEDRLEEIYLSFSKDGYDENNEKILYLVIKDPDKKLEIQTGDEKFIRRDVRVMIKDDGQLTSNELSVEEGISIPFKVRLSSKPTDTVTVDIILTDDQKQPIDPEEFGIIIPDSLTFDEDNWSIDQSVRLERKNNYIHEDDKKITICFDSSGGGYTDLVVLNLTITDNDTPGFTLSNHELVLTEGGIASFKVKLTTNPENPEDPESKNDVKVTIFTNNNSEIKIMPHELTFSGGSNGNWDTFQTVTIYSNEDEYNEGNQFADIFLSSNGGDYTSLESEKISVEIKDKKSPEPIELIITIFIGANILVFRFAINGKINDIDIKLQIKKDDLLSQIDENIREIRSEVDEIKEEIEEINEKI